MSQFEMFGANILLLIGALLCLLFSGLILLVLVVGLRVWALRVRQRRAWEEYRQRTRRADGHMYPPRTGGICEGCGRVRKTVYHLRTGERLCHGCYEAWRPTSDLSGRRGPLNLGSSPDPAGSPKEPLGRREAQPPRPS